MEPSIFKLTVLLAVKPESIYSKKFYGLVYNGRSVPTFNL